MKRIIIFALALFGLMVLVGQLLEKINPSGVKIVKSYKIGAYIEDSTKYSDKCIDLPKTRDFLNKISPKFKEGDIITIDGLKWQKTNAYDEIIWQPYPNPPMPVWKKGEDKNEHFDRYAQWIQDHPHFDLIPLPIVGLK